MYLPKQFLPVVCTIALCFGPAAAPMLAQCPLPAPAPPTLDGNLDDVYFQRGFNTDYVANVSNSTARLYQIDDTCIDPDFIYLAWEIELGFVDNSYGANRNKGTTFPWPAGHSFFDLAESDGQRLQILNVCGEDVIDLFMDYVDGVIGGGSEYDTPSGYGVSTSAFETNLILINGGDWSNFTYDTSILYNLNDLGFCVNANGTSAPAPDCAGSGPPGTPIGDGSTDLLVDSPPWSDENNYVPNSTYDGWLYNHIYEMRIARSVFSTTDCPQGTPALIRTDPVELHASPSKIGESPVDLFRASSTLGDFVWFDSDRDGLQDAGETGLANVTVALYVDDGDGVFEPDTPVIDGGLDMDRDGDVDADDDGTLGGITVIDGELDVDGDGTAGETNGDDDGSFGTLTVDDGRVDIDSSGGINASDDGILANDDGSPAATTVTDTNGRYIFTQLGAATYFVDVTDDNGILNGLSLTVGAQSQTDPSSAIVLPLQEENLDVDFGYAPTDLTTAVIGDRVWSDADNDGIQDPGESGIGGVTLDLIDFNTMAVVATTTTAADGSYLFTGVAAGDYQVDVTDTGSVLSGYALTTGPQSETDPTAAFHVDAADVYLNADFGYFNASLGSIGNQVFFDSDEDATFDVGEPGIGSVTLALIDDADGDGVWDDGELIIASATTDNNGAYSFPGLSLDDGGGDSDADYLVAVTDVNGVLGQLLLSINLPLGSTSDGVSKIPAYSVDLAAGSTSDTTADFGYLLDNPEALVGDRVWYDQDGDGVQDFDEPGIEGVRMVLWEDNNKNGIRDGNGGQADEPIGSRVTDINGNYYFQRLRFDNNGEGYIVVVSDFNSIDIIDGRLDLDRDGVIETNGDDDGTIDGVTVDDGLLDLDDDGTAGETNGDDSGNLSGLILFDGAVDVDRDSTIESNGDDDQLGPLNNFVQTGDPDEVGTCTTCNGLGATEVDNSTRIDLDLDFGYDGVGTFSIGDTVYLDTNGDGDQDVGESGLELVTVGLYLDLDGDGVVDVDEPLVDTETTDASGNYLFDDLVSADYIVAVTDQNGILVGYTQTQGSAFEPVDSSELSTVTVDFGFVRNEPANLSNFVWDDLDGDGVQDGGEPGIPNATVNVYDPGGDGMPGGGDDTLVDTTTTDASGLYSFPLPAGNYFVEIVAPTGYVISLQNIGSDTTDSDADPTTGQAEVTTLIIGENDPTWDLGLYRPVYVGDRVWLDVDGDGIQDVGEPGLSNVTVELDDGSCTVGVDCATAVTDLYGNYLFDQRVPATYSVDLDASTLPSGLTLSGGSDPSSGSTLQSGTGVLTKDFGYTDNGSGIIGDFLWSDADNDGVQDPGEPGIGGVTIDLIGAGADGIFGTGDDTTATTTTAADGSYYFTSLAAGDYRVDVTDTNTVLSGYTLSSGPQSSSDPTAPITLTAGEIYLAADFGYFQASLGTIGNQVWLDADGDGVFDAGESGLGGVSVALVADSDGDGVRDAGEPIVASLFSASDGTYTFTGLDLDDGGGDSDADYLVVVTDTDAVTQGMVRTSGSTGVDDNSQTTPYAVALSAGSPSNLTADFGYNRAGSIGDRIWNDADGDGIQDDGEAGIGGVTVELRDAGTGTLVATTTTAADGSYRFDLLLPDTYRVVVTDTGNVLTSYTQTGDPDEVGTCATCDEESTVALASGQSRLDVDFGYRNPALADISGTVFEDTDRDGVHDDPPETGIQRVTVELWHDVDGDGILEATDELVATTITDGSGNYAFPDLPNDDYLVVVSDREGVLTDYELTSGLDQIPVTLAGSDVTDVDFGYIRDQATGAIGDFVWLDADRDGVQDGAEVGLAGVDLDLYLDDGDGVFNAGSDTLVASTTTGLDGLYRFSGLAAGQYFVDLDATTLPSGVSATPGTSDPTALISLSSGEVYLEADFGYGSTGPLAAIGDFVWYDADSDGLQDPGELGISGVTITLVGPGCAPCTTMTDGTGGYLFSGLAVGSYTVTVDTSTLPAGYNTSPTNIGNTDYTIVLDGTSDVLTADWGFDGGTVGTIGDTVFLDVDGDGTQDAGDDGIAGVTINLLDSTGTTILATTVTDANGGYDFAGLPAGTYLVDVTDTAGLLAGLNLTAGSDPTAAIVLAAGQDYNDADFGYAPSAGVGTIGNFVWRDKNADGDVDAGENGVQGVTIDLWRDVDGNGSITAGVDNFLRTTTTDVNGQYTFDSLPAGTYLVDVTDTAGVLTGFTKTSGTAGTDDNSQTDPYQVTLTSGSPNNLTADFGYSAAADLTISGITYFDLNGDGTVTAVEDFGVNEVTVLLFRDLDGDGVLDGSDVVIDSLLSSGNGPGLDELGEYLFDDLPPGDYIVAVDATGTFLDGSLQTTQLASSGIQPVTLVATNSTDNDFGFTRTATVVLIGDFSAHRAGDRVVVEWTTVSENGAVGFYLYRLDPKTKRYEPVHRDLLPALFGAPQGGVYRQVDPFAGGSDWRTYLLAEVQARGIEQLYGPFTVELTSTPGLQKTLTTAFEAEPWRPSQGEIDRLARHQQLVARHRADKVTQGGATPRALELEVRESGLHGLSATALSESFGVPVGQVRGLLTAGRVDLRNRGRAVAWSLDPRGDGLLFYGEAIDSPFTLDNVYWLTLDRGVTMETRRASASGAGAGDAFVDGLHVEEEIFHATLLADDPRSDYWFWAGIAAGHPAVGSRSFVLDVPDVAEGDAMLTVNLRGASESPIDDEHHIQVSLGGQVVGDAFFDGIQDHSATFPVPEGLLRDGANTVVVTGLLDSGAAQSFFYVDSFDLLYPRRYRALDDRLLGNTAEHTTITVTGFGQRDVLVFDLSDPSRPVRLDDPVITAGSDGWQVSFASPAADTPFLAVGLGTVVEPELWVDTPSNLLASSNAADYLIVTSSELQDGAELLADYRRARGRTVEVVTLEDIDDELNHGIRDPENLRAFLAHAHASWSEAPTEVLLVGAGHLDYRGLLLDSGNVVPPLMVPTPYGLYSSDTRFGDVTGDSQPEIVVGRLPVLSEAEIETYIAKLQAYESTATGGNLLLADNPDLGGDFHADGDDVATFFPRIPESVYLGELSLGQARGELFDAFDRGLGWLNYLGHGGLDRFASEGLLTTADVPALGNGDRLPIVASLTCNVARFEIPGFTALGEALVLEENGGAIAVWAPTGLSLHFEAMQLNRALIDAIYEEPGQTLGDVVRRVLGEYQTLGTYDFMMQIYTLMGDPGLVVRAPEE